VIAILKSAALFVAKHFWVVLVPVFFSMMMMGWFVLWVMAMLYMWSIGTSVKRSGLPLGRIVWDSTTKIFIWFHCFNLCWTMAFLLYYG
jgi:Plasma-membrane choline transporter